MKQALARTLSRTGDGLWYPTAILLASFAVPERFFELIFQACVGFAFHLVAYTQIKQRVRRPRPFQAALAGERPTVLPLDEYSFPSGHSASAAFLAILLCSYVPMLAWVAIPWVLGVSWSRYRLGVHYLSDLVGGWALGLVSALVTQLISGWVFRVV